ncbi:Putative transcriptional regulator TACO1, integrase-like protein [Colletotrichum destructivum]|uniref:Transcriptional regulator TACO1, integrase-like protein n=1 Tax=Colletotrichum destructivum TaxID=34406 RepID=A0AAX4HXV8_9PEZI|nr:Putative transcriptional regulator TACO1, integrase-like protein [Colletotrichum destructivum]
MRPLAPVPVRSIASRIFAAPAPRVQPGFPFCHQCLRPLSTTPAAPSGHNKWSKIKHRKGAADAQKNSMRSQHSKMIALYSRPGVPKNVIDSAVARGQGRTASGASLEPLTLEAILPPGVALIIEAETESKARSLQDLKVLIKKHKGAANAAAFFFTRLGRVVFEAAGEGGGGPGVDDILDDAIEAGAEDLEADDDGNLVVWTQPNMTNAVASGVGPKFGLKLLSSDIIWSANDDTKVKLDKGLEATSLADLLAALQEFPEVQAVYGNPVKGDMSEEEWARIEENLDS